MSKNDNKSTDNSLVYVLFFLLVVILFIGIYFYINYKFIENKEFKNKYIITENLEFYDLPYSIKYKYQKKEDCPKSSFLNTDYNELKNKIKSLKKLNSSLHNKLNNIPALEDKITLLNNKIEFLEAKNNKLSKIKNTKVIVNNIETKINSEEKYNTLMCTNMIKSKYNMTKSCFNDIQKFALNNKDAKYFEVMGMISKEDFLKEDFQNDILKTGFASKRARVVIWTLREALEFKTKVLPVNYYITSSVNYRGSVIRAYY